MSHIFACFLVVFGTGDSESPTVTKWIEYNAGLWGEDTEDPAQAVTPETEPGKVFVFAYYWVWEVITTVGYGDRGIPIEDENIADVLFTLMIEFVGVLMQAVVINVMTDFASTQYSFASLVNDKMEPLQLWINKIQVSNKPYFLDPSLYKKIVMTVEDALNDDFNMIIEEFEFYQKLSPKMQTALIKEIFSGFIREFDHFMGSWEEGFRNEFVVNLFTRKYHEHDIFVHAGHEIAQVILITSGSANMLSKEDYKFMTLPKGGVFGDYQVAFNLKSFMTLKGPPNPVHIEKTKRAKEYVVCTTMNCEDEVFRDLLELYEDTAVNVKIRALEKREVFMYYLQKVRKFKKI